MAGVKKEGQQMSNEQIDSGLVATVIAGLGAVWGWILLHFGLKDRVTILETPIQVGADRPVQDG
jgi:hypothetical protein